MAKAPRHELRRAMLIRHSLLYMVARFVPGILGMMTTALLTRLLDLRGYGIYGLALVIMTFVSTMGFDWLGVSLMRFNEARRGDERVIATFVQIFLVLMLVSAGLTALTWACGLFSGAEASVYLLGLLLAWSYSWFEFAARVETANMRPFRYLTMNLARSACILLGAVGAAWLTHDAIWTMVGTGVGMFAGAMFGTLRTHRMAPRLFDRQLAAQVIAFGFPLAISMTLGSVVSSGTRALVQALGSSEALGLYTAAFILVQNTLAIMASGIASAGYPLAVRAVESGDGIRAQRQLLANGSLLLAMLAPACLGMALAAPGISTTLVGHRFSAGVSLLTPWMAAGTFFASIRAHFLDHAFQLGRRPSLEHLGHLRRGDRGNRPQLVPDTAAGTCGRGHGGDGSHGGFLLSCRDRGAVGLSDPATDRGCLAGRPQLRRDGCGGTRGPGPRRSRAGGPGGRRCARLRGRSCGAQSAGFTKPGRGAPGGPPVAPPGDGARYRSIMPRRKLFPAWLLVLPGLLGGIGGASAEDAQVVPPAPTYAVRRRSISAAPAMAIPGHWPTAQ